MAGEGCVSAMENTPQEMQPRIEAVLDEAIACGLLSGAVRPWLLKWLMAALFGEPLEGLTSA